MSDKQWAVDAAEGVRRQNQGRGCVKPGKYHYNSAMRDCPHCRSILNSDAAIILGHAPKVDVEKLVKLVRELKIVPPELTKHSFDYGFNKAISMAVAELTAHLEGGGK